MKLVKKCIAVGIYLVLICYLFDFQFWVLLDIRQLVVVIFGTGALYLPGSHIRQVKKVNLHILGTCSIYAAMIQSFILLFAYFTTVENVNSLLKGIALNCRPLLYGICIWCICYLAEEKYDSAKENVENQNQVEKETYTATSAYGKFIVLGLSKREAEVALQVAKGLSNAEIAAELFISETTVKKHITNIFQKLGIEKREQLKDKL